MHPLITALLLSCSVVGQGVIDAGWAHARAHAPRAQAPQVIDASGDGFRLTYEPAPEGRTLLRVLAPEGAHGEIWDGSTRLVSDELPIALDVASEHFYRVIVTTRQGRWEHKLLAKDETIASLWVTAPLFPPASQVVDAPSCVADSEFRAIKALVDDEPFSSNKLEVLRTAAPSRWFCVAQVGELIDTLAFSSDKVRALELLKDRIVDRQNALRLVGHFVYASDKHRALRLLASS